MFAPIGFQGLFERSLRRRSSCKIGWKGYLDHLKNRPHSLPCISSDLYLGQHRDVASRVAIQN